MPKTPTDLLAYERTAWARGLRRVGGVDEAGRGPLAGPVVAACVCFDPELLASHPHLFAGLTDSKLLSAPRRSFYYERLITTPGVLWSVARVEAEVIDRLNILRATHEAMRLAVVQLAPRPDQVLVDGLPVPGLPCSSVAIVKGDRLSLSIAAASVLAKVTRDRLMAELDGRHPGYGFLRHKGYPTRDHVEALRRLGPCAAHRRSFAPVRNAVADAPALQLDAGPIVRRPPRTA